MKTRMGTTKSRILMQPILFFIAFIILSFAYSSNLYGLNTSPVTGNFFQEQQEEKPKILYLVDGKPTTAKEVDKLDMASIEQLEYIKEKEKVQQYTEDDTIDIVVLITMKKVGKEEQKEE
jgi:hypothetical protein